MAFVRILAKTAKNHRLLITNTFANGLLLASGDLVVQQIEKYHDRRLLGIDKKVPMVDWKRTTRFFVAGLCFGPALHGWYTVLDKAFPAITARSVASKVVLDQIICDPLYVVYFYGAMGFLEQKSYTDCIAELKQKFLATYAGNCVIYPFAQTINFLFVPTKFRVIFVSTVTFFDSIFLSFLKTSEGKGQQFIQFVDRLFGF